MELIQYAFQVRALQISDAPNWAREERYDVTATLPKGTKSSAEQFRAVMREVLEDRFSLRVRREGRNVPIAALVIADRNGRLGPALTRATKECTVGADNVSTCRKVHRSGSMEVVGYEWSQITLPNELMRYGAGDGLMIVDRTGLSGRFDVSLKWAPVPEFRTKVDPDTPGAADGVSLVTALREQLGLSLRRERGIVEHLVIVTMMRPSAD